MITLAETEVAFLKNYKSGKRSLRQYNRANALLLLHKGKSAAEIAEFLDMDRITVWRIGKRYLENGLHNALNDDPRPGQPRKYDTARHAEIMALACSAPPAGRLRWTIRLLTEELRKRPGLETVSTESVRLVLKKTRLSPGAGACGVSRP